MSANETELASVVAKEFGEVLQSAGVEIVIVDNDKKTRRSLESNCGPALEKSKIGLSSLNLPARIQRTLEVSH